MGLGYRSRWWRFLILHERGGLPDLFRGYDDLGGGFSRYTFFCHYRSAQGNGGRKFICCYLPKDRYFIVLYLCFRPPPAGALVHNGATEAYNDTPPPPPNSQVLSESATLQMCHLCNMPISAGCREIPFMSRIFVGKTGSPAVPKPPLLANISSSGHLLRAHYEIAR